jgi:hypothetical protein
MVVSHNIQHDNEDLHVHKEYERGRHMMHDDIDDMHLRADDRSRAGTITQRNDTSQSYHTKE